MRYRATAFATLEDYHRRDRMLAGMTLMSTIVIQLQSAGDPTRALFWQIVWAIVGMALVLLLIGHRRQRKHYVLTLDGDVIRVQTPSGDEVSLSLTEVGAHVIAHRRRVLGLLPAFGHYYELSLPGGPLGRRALYFEHDGDYMRHAFERQNIEVFSAESHAPCT